MNEYLPGTGKFTPLASDCLKGRSVIIATPSGDSKYDEEYVFSLTNTLHMIEGYGAKVDWGRMPGCADLPYARSKILGAFLRGSHTDLMLIDDDMGWNPIDVVRLLVANRDFIAAAGPKKVIEPDYALNNSTDSGKVLPIMYEAETGFMYVTEVGMAFTLLSRNCVKMMFEHYTDLEFTAQDAATKEDLKECAVFDPLIIPGTKRRLSEDFAFCWRWRKIGGSIQIIPDITLRHCGKAVWEGNFLAAKTRKDRELGKRANGCMITPSVSPELRDEAPL